MPQIPAGWEETTLGKACIVMSWSTPSTKEELYRDWDISWITPKDLSNYNERYIAEGERNITEAWVKNSSAQILPPNTILFSSRAPIWYVAIAKKELTTNQGFKNIICDEKESHYLFFYYWLKYRSEYIEKISSGSTFTEASAAIMRSLPIHRPPLPEQQAIAAVLSSFDDKIELLRAENQTLEQMGQELFKERFGKWKIGDELPEGWRVGKLEEMVDLLNGFSYKSSDFVENGKYRLVTIANVQDWNFIEKTKDSLDSIPEKMPDHCLLKTGDILLSLTWNVGRVCLVIGEYYFLNQRVAKISPKNPIDYAYSYLYFRQKHMITLLESISVGTAQQNLSPIKTSGLSIIVPLREILDSFSEKANILVRKIIKNLEQIQTLSSTRDQLLPKLMSWEVRVKF